MRRSSVIGLGALAAITALSGFAEAQAQAARERPLVLTVRPRSFLDPGPAAPVGSMNRYVTTGQNSPRDIAALERERPMEPEPAVGARPAFRGRPQPVRSHRDHGLDPVDTIRAASLPDPDPGCAYDRASSSLTMASPTSAVDTALVPGAAMSLVRVPEASTLAIALVEQVGFVRPAERIAQRHAERADHRERVGEARAGDVGRRAVDGLVQGLALARWPGLRRRATRRAASRASRSASRRRRTGCRRTGCR